MYLGWIDYAILGVLLSFSAGIGIYQGCVRSKQLSASEFLVADGQMTVLPTAISLLAGARSAVSLLGVPVEFYLYGTMGLYGIFASLMATYITTKVFIPKLRQTGDVSIYSYLERRFSLSVRIMVTCTFILGTILYMGVILYGPSLALSQMTGLNIWLAVGSCGLVCTIYTSIGGIKAVIWTDVVQAVMMYLGLIVSIVFGIIDVGGIAKAVETVSSGNRFQFRVDTLDPSVRYTFWSVLIGFTVFDIGIYGCTQTQAQRYMCVKDTKTAKRVVWINYAMNVVLQILLACVGCVIYAKYSQCDPIKAKLISRSDQLYPLFVIQTLGRFPGFTGIFIASILSASLSTISSGVNSIATVIVEDIYKRISIARPMSNERQATVSKVLSIGLGLFTIFLAFIVSYMKTNIITIVLQIFGAFTAPILGVYLLGFFTARVQSRSALVAFTLCLTFQIWIAVGSTVTVKPPNKQGGLLPTSVVGCMQSVNTSFPMSKNRNYNPLIPLYSIAPTWFVFNGAIITLLLGLIFSFVCDSKYPKIVDKSLVITRDDIFSCCSSRKEVMKLTIAQKYNGISTDNTMIEKESMLKT
ncbi:unnamed protein product [Rotaria sordida]|uniref:Uncharacterized protein n=1 Tax=Rotaria sordida TaxID=392033 RepID=A0A814E4Q5_9BILA|nr:unnamed protein product [Rotaria sordida]